MRFCTVEGVVIGGLCACVPSNEVDNEIAGKGLFGDEVKNIIKATGIQTRRICPPGSGVTALDLCVAAAKKLFEKTPRSVHSSRSVPSIDEVGGILFVTQTPDHDIPNNSSRAAYLLGLSSDCAAVDTSFGCSGYVYGLWLGASMARSIEAPILLLDGETHSYFTSPKDRGTSLLFGDAGTATLILPGGGERWHFGFLTDGSRHDVLMIPEGRSRRPFNERSLEYKTWPDGGVRRPIDIYMDGMAVFNFVVRNVPGCLASLMERCGVTAEELDLLLLHQANLYMMKQVAKKLKIPLEKMPVSLDRYGNSSSATIPVTLCSELQKPIANKSFRVLASGFGAGLSISAVSMNLGPCACPGVIEYP
ncbi:MAG: ketoacyl-ACP synthase III [Synergistaceae bacterium]|jgi:3-oxoacyl-[acyl-carrier-protein] synthase-3|nr:ketoacyl-ACP synthase III [Synergistaceae bacterium]